MSALREGGISDQGFVVTQVDNVLNWARTGSLWPMNGGGPVETNACTAFAATTTRNSPKAKRPAPRGSRSPSALTSRSRSSSTPITASATTCTNHDQL